MSAPLTVALLSALFAGSHVLLATAPIRRRLVALLGEVGFSVLYSLVAWLTFGASLVYYAAHRFEGPPGLGLWTLSWLRWPAIISSVLGVCFVTVILSPRGYVESPMALFSRRTKQARGMDRITRHPMFAGMALFGLGHVVLAHRLVGVVYFGFLALLGIGGAWHQDAKLRARRGEAYESYLVATSSVPFVAVLRGRQKLLLRELPWLFLAAGLALAWGLSSLHGSGFAYGVHLALALLVVGPIGLTLWSYLKNRRNRSKSSAPTST